MLQRFLDPETLATPSPLDLVAKTVVDGFIAGLHRSPDFGFSQEFAEYRAYNEGDDLRHVDWNVFARTGKAFLKRYRGETNTQLLAGGRVDRLGRIVAVRQTGIDVGDHDAGVEVDALDRPPVDQEGDEVRRAGALAAAEPGDREGLSVRLGRRW